MLVAVLKIEIFFIFLFLSVLPAGESSEPADKAKSLYQRLEEKLKQNPELAKQEEKRIAALNAVKWMIGTWEVQSKVYATETAAERTEKGESQVRLALNAAWLSFSDSYEGSQDLGFLTFDPILKLWVSVQIDSFGDRLIMTSEDWKDDTLIFTGAPVSILGENVELRQTLTKKSDTEYRIVNEEKLANGRWVPVDEYNYKKK